MSESKLKTQSMDFAISVVNLVKKLKEKLKDVFTEGLEPSCPIRRRCFEPMCIPFHEVNLSMTIELVE